MSFLQAISTVNYVVTLQCYCYNISCVTVWKVFKKGRIRLPYVAVIPRFDITHQTQKNTHLNNICTPVLIVALGTIAQKQPGCQLIDNTVGLDIQWKTMQLKGSWNHAVCCNLSRIGWPHVKWNKSKGQRQRPLIRLICGIWNNMVRDWRVLSEDKSMDRGYWKKTEGRETEEDTKKRWQEGGNTAFLFKVSALGLSGVWKWSIYVYPNHWTHPT